MATTVTLQSACCIRALHLLILLTVKKKLINDYYNQKNADGQI